jgi:hypothetical protein
MATKTEIPITSEKKDTEKKMAVVKQRTDTRVEADINNSPSTKSLLNIMIMNTGGKNVGAFVFIFLRHILGIGVNPC